MDAYEDVGDIEITATTAKGSIFTKTQNSSPQNAALFSTMDDTECSREFEQLPDSASLRYFKKHLCIPGMVQVYYGYVQTIAKTRIRRTIMNIHTASWHFCGATDDEIKHTGH